MDIKPNGRCGVVVAADAGLSLHAQMVAPVYIKPMNLTSLNSIVSAATHCSLVRDQLRINFGDPAQISETARLLGGDGDWLEARIKEACSLYVAFLVSARVRPDPPLVTQMASPFCPCVSTGGSIRSYFMEVLREDSEELAKYAAVLTGALNASEADSASGPMNSSGDFVPTLTLDIEVRREILRRRGDVAIMRAWAKKAGVETLGDEILPSCWVCLEPGIRHGHELMRGCACRGSAGFAHIECLAEVAQSDGYRDGAENNGKQGQGYSYSTWTRCPTCKQDFSGATALALARAHWAQVNEGEGDDAIVSSRDRWIDSIGGEPAHRVFAVAASRHRAVRDGLEISAFSPGEVKQQLAVFERLDAAD